MNTGARKSKENFTIALFGSPEVTSEQCEVLYDYLVLCGYSEKTYRIFDISMSNEEKDLFIYRTVLKDFKNKRLFMFPYAPSNNFSFVFNAFKINDEDDDRCGIVENIIARSKRILILFNRNCTDDQNESTMWGIMKAMKLKKKITTVIREDGTVIEYLAQQPTEGRLIIDNNGDYVLENPRRMTELDI